MTSTDDHDAMQTLAPEGEWVGYPPPTVVPDCYIDTTDLIFVHRCSWWQFGGARLRKTVLSQERWQVHQTIDGQLTVTPSIHCKACGLHGFFTDGAWRNA